MSWQKLTEAVARCEQKVADAAPDTATAEEGRAYVARLVSASLGTTLLGHLLAEGGLSRPLPVNGGPNPDYRMHFAPVDPAGQYRLSGWLKGSERVGVGLYCYGEGGAPLERGYRTFDASNVGPDGGFDIVMGNISGDDVLAIAPDVRILLIRILHRDAAAEPARLTLSGGAAGNGLTKGDADGALAFVAASLERAVGQYLLWSQVALEQGNRLAPAPPHLAESAQGDPDTLYFLGGFDLKEGEWLELEMPAPTATYWSIHAYSHWFEHLRTAGVDDANVKTSPDGLVRIAIGPSQPANAPNRLDTAGRRRGALICRIIGEGECPTATVRTGGER